MSRACGGCTLCCRLLPVVELNKGANERCAHQCIAGCVIYAKRPDPCRLWSCLWLAEPQATAGLQRPDSAHYVIDVLVDQVYVGPDKVAVPALQVWVDPEFRDAHRDPALRAFVARMGEERGWVAIIRYGGHDGFVLVPPSMNEAGEWIENAGEVRPREVMRRGAP